MKMKQIFFYVILFSFLGGMVFAQSDLQPAAIVNLIRSEPITGKQLRTEVENFEKGLGRVLTETERREVLDNIINERLVQQAAERDKIMVTDSEVEREVQNMKTGVSQNLGRTVTDAEFAQMLKAQTGLELSAYRNEIRKTLINQKYMRTKKPDVFNQPSPPSENEIKKFYEDNQTKFIRPQTLQVSLIQIPFGTEKTKAKELADNLAREIGSGGAKFMEVSSRGRLPNSIYKSSPEDIYLPRNEQARATFGDEFVDAIFNLKAGDISKVINGKDAYYLAKIVTVYPLVMLTLEDIYQLGAKEPMTIRDYISNGLMGQKQQETLVKATQELVEELRANGKTFQVFEKNLSW